MGSPQRRGFVAEWRTKLVIHGTDEVRMFKHSINDKNALEFFFKEIESTDTIVV